MNDSWLGSKGSASLQTQTLYESQMIGRFGTILSCSFAALLLFLLFLNRPCSCGSRLKFVSVQTPH